MPTARLNEKIAQLEAQESTIELELYLLQVRVKTCESFKDPGKTGEPAAVNAFNQFQSELLGYRARLLYEQHRLAQLQIPLTALREERGTQAAKPS